MIPFVPFALACSLLAVALTVLVLAILRAVNGDGS